MEATSNKVIATSKKGITTRNKKLVVAKGITSSSSSLLVTRASLLVAGVLFFDAKAQGTELPAGWRSGWKTAFKAESITS